MWVKRKLLLRSEWHETDRYQRTSRVQMGRGLSFSESGNPVRGTRLANDQDKKNKNMKKHETIKKNNKEEFFFLK